MHCLLCNQPIGGGFTLPLIGGGQAHLACTIEHARRMRQAERQHALSLALGLMLLLIVTRQADALIWCMAVSVTLFRYYAVWRAWLRSILSSGQDR